MDPTPYGYPMTEPEKLAVKLALELADSEPRLLARLHESRDTLTDGALKSFGQGVFQLGCRRLVSDDGTWALAWQLRERPDEPIAYDNQQTTVGYVCTYGLKSVMA